MAMAILLTATHQASAAELTHEATVQVSDNESVYNLSVFPGKAGYSNDTVSGVFGDGTVVDYRFFMADADSVWSWIDGGEGRVADITSPPAANVAGAVNNSQNWPDVWVTGDPDFDPADFTTDTQAGAQNITGTIDVSGLGKGVLYFMHGTYHDAYALSLTMSGTGQPDVEAEYADDPENTVNMGWVTSFTFATGGAYSTITYSYTNNDADGSRARFMGVIVDGGDASKAQDLTPGNEDLDVSRDVDLTWVPGQFAATHNLYVGETFEEVDTATVPTASDLTIASFDPGRLNFGQTYFWRVDEVNGTPDKTVHRGEVWSFEVEPYSILVSGDTITVTASSVSNEFSTADKVIDGSGLDANGVHAMDSDTMWFTASVDLDPWIQFEFDDVKKLDIMKVWNSNSPAESAIGWGVKDVIVEVSVDGATWDVLADATQFSRAPGSPTYNQPDHIDFGGAAAKFVRLDIQSNWGGIIMSYGLSEVQFSEIPVKASTPDPAVDAVNILPNAVLTWRAGRQADQHTVYVSTDVNAVIDGTAPSVAAQTTSLDLTTLDLALDQTYFWRVDEVNDAEVSSVWAGDVWSFDTPRALVVDNFEGYSNASPKRPFQTWLDGFGYSSDEFFAQDYAGNGTGSGVGHDIWSLSSPHFDGAIMETANTLPGSGQSMPFYYTNSGGVTSQTERMFTVPQDWTVGGAVTLSIAFNGRVGNTGTMFVVINNAKIVYDRDNGNISRGAWQAWNIDLAAVNTTLTNVTKLTLGVEGAGASGMILFDDIGLYAQAGELIVPEDPGVDGLVGAWNFDDNTGMVATDSSGNGRHGTIVDAAWQPGKQGSALNFDGLTSYVNIDGYKGINAIDAVQQAFTIANWIKTTVGEGEMVTWGTNVGRQRLTWRINGDTLRTEHGSGNLRGNTPVNDDEWHHVALVVTNGADLTVPATQIFLDGQPDSTFSGSGNPYELTPDVDVRIGMSGPQGGRFFTGLIDEVLIYDRALDEAELLWLAGRTGPIDKPF
ncbi:MAG: discoidin domain-containing protein [Phycisphaeraceae bacterium]|nr:discoidin domain-containing protein [Phycisphaeraceae bacterium]